MGKFALKHANRQLHQRIAAEGPSKEDLERERRNAEAAKGNSEEADFTKAVDALSSKDNGLEM